MTSASALLLDYTLDVSVSVASGVQSATSALPFLGPWHVPLALIALALIMIANLRGIRTAGILFSLPIYGYIFGSAAVIVYGLTRWAGGSLPPYTPPPAAQDLLGQPAAALGLLLILRAFSSGAVALTGIEAVSNGVPYYKEPEVQNAHRWLVALAISFGALFIGISFLAARIGIVPDPTETETLHSQLTRTLVGTGPAHTLLQVCALLLLIVAADTGFADFPRLLSLLARDGYLPHAFAERGARLAFSNGVVAVAVISAVLIVLPVLILTFRSLGLHHEQLAQRVSVASSADGQDVLSAPLSHYGIISVEQIDNVVLQTVAYARRAGGHVEAVHCTDDSEAAEKLRSRRDALDSGIPLIILNSPYRATAGALERYLDFVQEREPPETFITLMLPEVLPTQWWHPLLHNYFAWQMKFRLLFRPRTAVTSVPYSVRD